MGEIDPLALDVTNEINRELERQKTDDGSNANWEHQELAQVCYDFPTCHTRWLLCMTQPEAPPRCAWDFCFQQNIHFVACACISCKLFHLFIYFQLDIHT